MTTLEIGAYLTIGSSIVFNLYAFIFGVILRRGPNKIIIGILGAGVVSGIAIIIISLWMEKT